MYCSTLVLFTRTLGSYGDFNCYVPESPQNVQWAYTLLTLPIRFVHLIWRIAFNYSNIYELYKLLPFVLFVIKSTGVNLFGHILMKETGARFSPK